MQHAVSSLESSHQTKLQSKIIEEDDSIDDGQTPAIIILLFIHLIEGSIEISI